MNVCFLAGTLGRGGAERQLIYMLRALQLEGIEPRLLCLTAGEAFEKEIADLGIRIEWVGSSPNRAQRLLQIARAIKKYPTDIIQSSHFYTNIYVALAGRYLAIPNIGAIRSDLNSEIAADRVFGRWQFKLPDHLVANSTLAVERAYKRGLPPGKIDIVKNIVEVSGPAEPRRAFNKTRLRILFAGRLHPAKRPDVFLRLARRLRDDLPDAAIDFELAGDGPIRPEMQKLKNDLGLTDQDVVFSGEQSDMAKVYKKADILVLTSAFEGTPNVLLEAMSNGLPVVATRVGGVPEVVAEGSGILVDPENFDDLVDAVRKLILDRDHRISLGRHGQEFVLKNHSITYLQKRLTGIYEKQLNRCQVRR